VEPGTGNDYWHALPYFHLKFAAILEHISKSSYCVVRSNYSTFLHFPFFRPLMHRKLKFCIKVRVLLVRKTGNFMNSFNFCGLNWTGLTFLGFLQFQIWGLPQSLTKKVNEEKKGENFCVYSIYRCVRKYPNDQFFWHNFFVCGYFSTIFSGFLHNMNTHIHKWLSGIYRYLYISWIKKSKNASTESFRTLWYFRF
jgi:hypothetical protein